MGLSSPFALVLIAPACLVERLMKQTIPTMVNKNGRRRSANIVIDQLASCGYINLPTEHLCKLRSSSASIRNTSAIASGKSTAIVSCFAGVVDYRSWISQRRGPGLYCCTITLSETYDKAYYYYGDQAPSARGLAPLYLLGEETNEVHPPLIT